uniref:C2H2-type domain-containing protein n=1 Tax=Anas platyrhynchos platyrhynchos TaxID=8840 RepID=A0A493TW39_ANAPP
MTDLASPTGENPFAFPGGEEGFGDEKALVIHSQAEEEEAGKEFKCILCGECFGQQPSLARHQKHHAGERAFICAECGKAFSLKHNLIIHQQNKNKIKTQSSRVQTASQGAAAAAPAWRRDRGGGCGEAETPARAARRPRCGAHSRGGGAGSQDR